MAKIAILFLLVALVAVSSGYRVARDLPAPPSSAPDFVKTLVDDVNKFISEGNLNKLKEQSDKIAEHSTQLGNTASEALQTWFKNIADVVKDAQEKLAPK